MAGRIPEQFIQDLLGRVDIAAEIGSRIQLRKAGRDYVGLCPFHQEKTPSFYIVPDKQIYHCFGCQKSGSILGFLMEHDGLDFVQAVELLAASVGLSVPREADSPDQSRARAARERLYAVLEQVAAFYAGQLRSHPGRARAVDYLKGRGLTGHTAKHYALGYAAAGGELLKKLGEDEETRAQLLKAGLVVADGERGVYDRFRDRIVFPIRDRRGRVVAFGGRLLGDGKPKYLNSPTSEVFEKGRELYGLHEALKAARSLGRLILVEGYMDVALLSQEGVTNSVATLGTAVTRHHVEQLFSLVDDLIFAFDGDAAGRAAGWKAAETCLPLMRGGRTVRFLFLPEGEDPDSLIRKEGREAFLARLDQAAGLADVVFEQLRDRLPGVRDSASGDLTLEQRGKLADLALRQLAKLPEGPFLALMKQRLQELVGLERDELETLASGLAPPQEADVKHADARARRRPLPPLPPDSSSLADKALRMLLKSPMLAFEFDAEVYRRLKSDAGLLAEVAVQILNADGIEPNELPDRLQLNDDYLAQLRRLREWELGPQGMQEEYRGAIHRMVKSMLVEEKREEIASLKGRGPGDLSAAERARWRQAWPATGSPPED